MKEKQINKLVKLYEEAYLKYKLAEVLSTKIEDLKKETNIHNKYQLKKDMQELLQKDNKPVLPEDVEISHSSKINEDYLIQRPKTAHKYIKLTFFESKLKIIEDERDSAILNYESYLEKISHLLEENSVSLDWFQVKDKWTSKDLDSYLRKKFLDNIDFSIIIESIEISEINITFLKNEDKFDDESSISNESTGAPEINITFLKNKDKYNDESSINDESTGTSNITILKNEDKYNVESSTSDESIEISSNMRLNFASGIAKAASIFLTSSGALAFSLGFSSVALTVVASLLAGISVAIPPIGLALMCGGAVSMIAGIGFFKYCNNNHTNNIENSSHDRFSEFNINRV